MPWGVQGSGVVTTQKQRSTLGVELGAALAGLLRGNNVLRELACDGNQLTRVGLESLHDGLVSNHTLLELPAPVRDAAREARRGDEARDAVAKLIAQVGRVLLFFTPVPWLIP